METTKDTFYKLCTKELKEEKPSCYFFKRIFNGNFCNATQSSIIELAQCVQLE